MHVACLEVPPGAERRASCCPRVFRSLPRVSGVISVRMVFFFSSRRRHTRWTGDWSSDVCSSDLGSDSLAPSGRDRSLFASCDGRFRFAAVNVDLPEGGQGGGYAVQFILESCAFFLELASYRLQQCFWHEVIVPLALCRNGSCSRFSE